MGVICPACNKRIKAGELCIRHEECVISPVSRKPVHNRHYAEAAYFHKDCIVTLRQTDKKGEGVEGGGWW